MNRPARLDDSFLSDVLDGLAERPRTIPCKYLYDERGSALFEEICELDAYYPTRAELSILTEHGAEISRRVGAEAAIVEYGSGAGVKTTVLLDSLQSPACYAPVEISETALAESVRTLRKRFDDLPIEPVCADYTRDFELPVGQGARRVVFFGGSTIGNFSPAEAKLFLRRIKRQIAPGGGLLIGVDLVKSPHLLHRAYNDEEGVTARFNRNLLVRINRELGADFDVDAFAHHASYSPVRRRVESYLVSLSPQTVRLAGESFEFEEGEPIHTENSYKYTVERFAELAASAGLEQDAVWVDSNGLFSLQYFRAAM
jgi:dimethylhistidine N-methyltransferase